MFVHCVTFVLLSLAEVKDHVVEDTLLLKREVGEPPQAQGESAGKHLSGC